MKIAPFKLRTAGVWLLCTTVLAPSMVLLAAIVYWGNDFFLQQALLEEKSKHVRVEAALEMEAKRMLSILQNKSDPIAYALNSSSPDDDRIDFLLQQIISRESAVHSLCVYVSAQKACVKQRAQAGYDIHINGTNIPVALAVSEHGRSFVGAAEMEDGQSMEFIMSVPLQYQEHGEGVLIAVLDVDAFAGPVVELFSDEHQTYLLNGRGVLLQNTASHPKGEMLTAIPIVRELLTHTDWRWSNAPYQGLIGQPAYGISSHVPVLNWGMVTEIDASRIDAKVAAIVMPILVLQAVFALLVFVLGYALVRKMIAPIQQMGHVAKRIGQGEYDVLAAPSSIAELNQLGQSINAMVQKVERSRCLLQLEKDYANNITVSITEGLLVLDGEGNIVRVNPAICTLLGYSERELLGRSMDGFVLNAMDDDGSQLHDVYHQDGSAIPCIISRAPMLDAAGNALGQVVTMNDMREHIALINAKQQAEGALAQEQHQRLESLGILAGGVAHDFNNLLTPIIGNAELIQQYVSGNPEMQLRVKNILDAALQASRLSKQMLSYAGSGRIASMPMNMTRMIRQMQEVLRGVIHPQVDLQFDLDASLPDVAIDVGEIEQVILNLVVNASDALCNNDQSHPVNDARISISTARSRMQDACEACPSLAHCQETRALSDDVVQVSIEDNGCGMSPEVISKIFNPFFTTKATGRGLGMAAVKGIIDHHQGQLCVHSEEGKGTCFLMYLPALAGSAQVETVDGASEEAGVALHAHVLIIDDDELVQMVLQAHLSSIGCSAIVASNGQEGLDVYREHKDAIDVVILDMTMPVMSGDECFLGLKAMNPDVKVILSSGYSSDQLHEDFHIADVDAFLSKPYRAQDVRQVLSGVL